MCEASAKRDIDIEVIDCITAISNTRQLACLASVSARVRRESLNESKKKKKKRLLRRLHDIRLTLLVSGLTSKYSRGQYLTEENHHEDNLCGYGKNWN